jgi:hypothetical protein
MIHACIYPAVAMATCKHQTPRDQVVQYEYKAESPSIVRHLHSWPNVTDWIHVHWLIAQYACVWPNWYTLFKYSDTTGAVMFWWTQSKFVKYVTTSTVVCVVWCGVTVCVCVRVCIPYSSTQARMQIHTRAHARMHARTYARTHARTHAHTRAYYLYIYIYILI